MKTSILTFLLASTMVSVQAQITETATEAVKNMGIGWNLGNTLDANNGTGKDITAASYWGKQGLESETCWGQPYTKPELLKMMKNAGFDAIRVPITWYNHMDKDGNVDKAWMKRVHEVVDYVIDNDLYCIINVHHDTGADSDSFAHWIHADETNYKNNKEKYEALWKQIAEEFKDYGNKLLFESYNEMLDAKSTWNAPLNTSSYNAINSYAQSFVDIVRASGGNNETRNLVINTYAAANGADAVKNLALPKDPTKDRTIVEVHAYPNFFTWGTNKLRTIKEVKNDVDYIFNTLKNNVISKGVPAIIGEWSSFGVDNGAGLTDYDVRKDMFFEFCEYFVKKAKENNVATFYWMGLTDGRYRIMPAFHQADLAELLAKAYHGADFKGEYPEPQKQSSYELVTEPIALMNWGTPRIQIPNEYFQSFDKDIEVTLTYTFKGDDEDVQLFYADWKEPKPKFTANGKEYDGDYFPHNDYQDSETCTTTLSFSADVCEQLKKRGLIIFGHNYTVTKAVLTGSSDNAIEQIGIDGIDGGICYDLSGNRVSADSKGFMIRNGKVLLVK